MRTRGYLRRLFPFLLATLLGAAAVILPAVASSEAAPAIEAVNKGGGIYEKETHAWSPSQATIVAGGTVMLSNPTTVLHGVEWKSPPAMPSCTGSVPVGTSEAAAGKNWMGTCTFTTPGTYTFWCTRHHSEMIGTITVNASGTTPLQTTPASGGSPTPPTTTSSSQTPSPGAGGSGATGSPLAGSASHAVKLASSQHGKAVHGSVAISPAGAGGRLEVDLLARTTSLASAGQAAQVRVGRFLRSGLAAGRMAFSVRLSTRARRALRRHGRLGLSVKVIVTPASGPAVTITRRVVVHA